MPKHKVINAFTDIFNGHYYVAGNAYPGKYGSATKERLNELKKKGFIEEEADKLKELEVEIDEFKAENEQLKAELESKEEADKSKELEAENADLKAEIEKLKAELEAKKEKKPAKEKK